MGSFQILSILPQSMMSNESRLVVEINGICIVLLLRTCRPSQRGDCLVRDLILIHYRMVVGISLSILLLVLSLLRMDLVLGLDSRWMMREGWIGQYVGYLLLLRLIW